MNIQNSHCFPEPSCRVHGPYTSTKKLADVFDDLDFVGGGGEAYSLGQEAIASALKVLLFLLKSLFKSNILILTTFHVKICESHCLSCNVFFLLSINFK